MSRLDEEPKIEEQQITDPITVPAPAVVQRSGAQRPGAPRPVEAGNSLGLWVRDLLVSAAASIFIILFLYQPVRVEGTSMLPRLEDRDRLFINKFVYH